MNIVSPKSDGKPLRILMIAPTSFFSDYGGHIRILEETRALQALGHSVSIVTYYKGSDIPGLDIRRTAPLLWHTDYEVGSSRHKLAFDVYLAASAIVQGLKIRPDLIHGHMHEGALIGGVVARLLGIPLVFDYQGSMTAEMVDHKFLDPNGAIFPLAHRMERFISRRLPDAILTSSLQARKVLCDEFQVSPQIIHSLPDCADTERFHPGILSREQALELRHQLGIPQDKTVVAYLGLLTDYQGIPYLIEAASILKRAGEQIHFLIMGYPNVQHYENLAGELDVDDCVTFTGKIEYRDAPRYLSLGDIAIAPKVSTTEGSGKLLNYMALAQPVIAFDTPVHREYLADRGVYVPPENVTALSAAIEELAHDPAQCFSIGQQLRIRAKENYSWGQAGKKIEELYWELTHDKIRNIM
jgi:glycosyltransferase involved in cell wall biosynthesis